MPNKKVGKEVDKETNKQPSYVNFNTKDYAWKSDIDYRKYPEKYKVGKGEQGVLICEPYKSEIMPYWKFKDRNIAKESATKIYELFLNYLKENDFVGADLARKFLQMGFTRSRRYTNYKGGRKYSKISKLNDATDTTNTTSTLSATNKTDQINKINKIQTYTLLEKGTGDPEKAISASIFYAKWQEAENNLTYAKLKGEWKGKYG